MFTRADPEYLYDAFISYRRSDGEQAARWLRRALTSFRIPRRPRQGSERRFKIYLDTAYERGAFDFYEQNVKPALLSSRHLIVVASPNAVQRGSAGNDWIVREVNDFLAHSAPDRLIAVRGVGDLVGPLPAGLDQRFPLIEIIDLREAHFFAFMNPFRLARLSSEKLKIVATLMNILPQDMPLLRKEEEWRQQLRLGAIVGTTTAVLVAVSLLSAFALQSRYRATRALESSMFSTGRMVQSIATQLSRDGDLAPLRRRILNEGCDLIDKLRIEADREARITELVTCRVERSQQFESVSDKRASQNNLEQAVELARTRYGQRKTREAIIALLGSERELASFKQRNGDTTGYEKQLQQILADSRDAQQTIPVDADTVIEEADAQGLLGDAAAQRDEHMTAASQYGDAATTLARARELAQDERKLGLTEWLVRLYRLRGDQLRLADDAASALGQYLKAKEEAAGRRDMGEHTFEIEWQAALATAAAAQIMALSNLAGAGEARADALAKIDSLVSAADCPDRIKKDARQLELWVKQSIPDNSPRHEIPK